MKAPSHGNGATSTKLESVLEAVAGCFNDTIISAPAVGWEDSRTSPDMSMMDIIQQCRGDPVLKTLKAATQTLFTGLHATGTKSLPLMLPCEFLKTIQTLHATDVELSDQEVVDQCEPGLPLSLLSPESRRLYRRHTRELTVLLVILQRPAKAYNALANTNYRNLHQALSMKNLVESVLSRVEEVLRCLQTRHPKSLALLTRLLSLYVDILFHFIIYHDDADDAERGASVRVVADRLIAVIHTLTCDGAEVRPMEWKRCAALLVTLVARDLDQLSISDVEKVVLYKNSWVHFLVFAAVPIAATTEDGSSMQASWLSTAMPIVFQSTLYDTDMSLLFRLDGPTQKSVLLCVKQTIGRVLELLWLTVSSAVWQYFTAPALLSAVKSCSMYAFTWTSMPETVWSLNSFIHHGLQASGSHSRSGYSSFVSGSPNSSRYPLQNSSAVRALVAGALGVPAGEASPVSQDERGAMSTTAFHTQSATQPPSPLDFDTAKSRTLFFLTLHGFASAAWLYAAQEFESLTDIFLWAVPHTHTDGLFSSSTAAADESVSRSVQSLGFAITPPCQEGKVNLLTLSLDYIAVLVKTPGFANVQANSTEDPALYHFFEGAFSLLHALLFSFPHELSRIREFAQRDLLAVFVSVTLNRASPNSRQAPYIQELMYDLLQRYYTAPISLSSFVSSLLTPELVRSMGDSYQASRLLVADLTLFTYLATVADECVVQPERIILLLVDIEPSVLLRTLEGVSFYANLIQRLLAVLATNSDLSIGSMALRATGEGRRRLMDRLAEGTSALFYAYQCGAVIVGGVATVHLLQDSLEVLSEVIRCAGDIAYLSTSCVASSEDMNDDYNVPVTYVLLNIFFTEGLPLEIYDAVGQILCAVVSVGHSLFPTLRSNLLREMRLALAGALHRSITGGIGHAQNTIRLEVLRVIGRYDLNTLQYFTGPEALPANHKAVEQADLAITQSLCAVILSDDSQAMEKAAALEILLTLRLVDALHVSRVAALLSDCAKTGGPHSFEACALAAAAAKYLNAVVVHLLGKEGPLGATPSLPKSATSATDSPSLTGRGRSFGIGSFGAEHIDAILRRGVDILHATAMGYEALADEIDFADYTYATAPVNGSVSFPGAATPLVHTTGFGVSALSTVAKTNAEQPSASMLPSVNYSKYHTYTLPSVVEMEETRERRLYPLVLGEDFCFTEGNATANLMASSLEAIRRLCVSMEDALWLSTVDGELTGALQVNRSKRILQAVLRCVMISKPSAPLLCRPLGSCVTQCLQLACAISQVSDLSNLEEDGSTTTLSTAHALRQLTVFLEHNRSSVALVNASLKVLGAALPSDVVDCERVFEVMADVLKRHQATGAVDVESLEYMRCCTVFFSAAPSNSCPFHLLGYWVPALFERAQWVSRHIPAGQADECESVRYFVQVIHCLKSVVINAQESMVLALLPREQIVSMMAALGQFSTSSVADPAHQVHRRQNWHLAWCALLDLLNTALLVGGHGVCTALETGFLPTVAASLCHIPRFLHALGGFTAVQDEQRRYCVWEVEEMELCTKMVALMSTLGTSMGEVLPVIQCSFLLHTQRPHHLLRSVVASDLTPSTVQLETKVMESALIHMQQYQLLYFLRQPGRGFRPAGVRTSAVSVVSEWSSETSPLTFGILRRFLLQQFQIIRKSAATAEGRSPEVSATVESSSLARSPSCGRETDSFTEDDVTDVDIISLNSDMRMVQVEVAQMALRLYTVAAEELAFQQYNVSGAPNPSAVACKELKNSTEKLLHALRSAHHDMKRMNSPKVFEVVEVLSRRLKAVVAAL